MDVKILEIIDLEIMYRVGRKSVIAVRDVSLAIEKREIRAVVGESGSGKSTLASAVLRVLPGNARIVRGSIMFDGVDLLKLPEREMRRIRGSRIGIIFQDPSATFNPVMRVGDHIAELLYVHRGTRWEEGLKVAESLVKRFGIPSERVYDYPHQLSGGMKQRFCIAMAIATNPELVIADEPTTALDVVTQMQVLSMLRELRDEYGTSIMFITHDLSLALSISDNVTVMYGGEIVEEAPSDDLRREPLHPYTQMLLECIPRLRQRLDFRRFEKESIELPSTRGCIFSNRCRYARERCLREEPPLIDLGGRRVRCWLYE
ncbi:MAG: ABC transporter ATP-binding protein [Crenarchaeota archaeon]|nr:ABC transporter ATP-binding protein [Thermoproteota archaeon]